VARGRHEDLRVEPSKGLGRRKDFVGVRELWERARADETRRLHPPNAGGMKRIHDGNFPIGRDQRPDRLEAIPRANLNDRDRRIRHSILQSVNPVSRLGFAP
jgi:hypothetical protein